MFWVCEVLSNSPREYLLENTLSLTKLFWTWTYVFIFVLSLWFLRLLNALGSEFDILIRWVSAISLVLCGVFAGVLISQKRIRVRTVLFRFLLFALGFLAAPFVGIAVLMLFEDFGFDVPAIFGVSVTIYLLFYVGLGFWFRKKGVLKLR
jgi:hypothetical protein